MAVSCSSAPPPRHTPIVAYLLCLVALFAQARDLRAQRLGLLLGLRQRFGLLLHESTHAANAGPTSSRERSGGGNGLWHLQRTSAWARACWIWCSTTFRSTFSRSTSPMVSMTCARRCSTRRASFESMVSKLVCSSSAAALTTSLQFVTAGHSERHACTAAPRWPAMHTAYRLSPSWLKASRCCATSWPACSTAPCTTALALPSELCTRTHRSHTKATQVRRQDLDGGATV